MFKVNNKNTTTTTLMLLFSTLNMSLFARLNQPVSIKYAIQRYSCEEKTNLNEMKCLTLSWPRSPSYRNQSIDLLCKSMDWFPKVGITVTKGLKKRYTTSNRLHKTICLVYVSPPSSVATMVTPWDQLLN